MKLLPVIALMLSCALLHAQPKSIDQLITTEKIQAHIGFLASDAMRGRDTGSPELKIAAEYVKAQFIRWGVKPVDTYPDFFQPVPLKTQSAPQSGGLKVGEQTYALGSDALLVGGSNGQWSADIVFVEYGEEKDFEGLDAEGKLLVARCGAPGVTSPQEWLSITREKRSLAAAAGASGLIELYNSQQVPWSLLSRILGRDRTGIDEGGEDDLFAIWVNDSNNENIGLFQSEDLTGEVDIVGAQEKTFVSQNVVGFIEGTDPTLKNEYVVYSAHYDHVGIGRPDAEGDSIYNGARDNAVGTVTVMAMAEYFSKNPPKRSALFILFTAEEKGLLGSRYFVENSPVALRDIVYCFNSDNGGYNDTSLATIMGFERTTAQSSIAKACKAYGLKAIEDPAKEQGLFDRSDNVNFAAKGIPAPTFSLGFTAFDQEIAKYYHQPSDEPASLDYPYLLKFFRSYVYTGLLIADLKERPFWVEGDKYYSAGKALYDGQ